jgi:DNA-directed RNA polymerase subunit D
MEIIKEKNDQISFKAEISESLANAIRRYVNQIPVAAIDELEIVKNDSPLYDETVAHRVGLIPLKEDKSVKENSEIELKLAVKKEGPVYSGEFKGKLEVVYDSIPITILNKNQEMELIAHVKIGKGEKHSKFSPGLIFYRNVVNVNINKDCPKEIVNKCPKGLLKLQGDKIVIEDSLMCDACEICSEECEKNNKDFIQIVPTKELIITVESFGQIDKKEIFSRSIDVLKKDLSELSKNIK